MVLNRLLQRFFERRGYTADFLREIDSCPHIEPKDTDLLCQRLKHYFDTKQRIVLLTDFDMDGIMSGVIGYAGLAELGFCVSLFLPTVSNGYGFDASTIDQLVSQYPDVSVILTADVGVSAYEGIQRANSYGIEVLVTDHHTVKRIPNASVVVDPSRPDDTDSYVNICGAHVLYQVLWYYVNHYTEASSFLCSQIERLRVFAGFGTISDSMELFFENRDLVRDALSITRMVYGDGQPWIVNVLPGSDIYRRAFHGLYVLLSVLKEHKKLYSADDITEDLIGYYIAPMFNSVKRMDGNIADAYLVFFGASPQDAAETLFALNEDRKLSVASYYSEMVSADQPWAPYIYVTDAPAGICGLLAQKLMSSSNDPVAVVRKDQSSYHGSGRSPVWFPFFSDAEAIGCYVGGHPYAFGIGLQDSSQMDSLYALMKQRVPALRPPETETMVKPDFVIATDGSGDTDIDVSLFRNYLDELQHYRPFGVSFPKPVSLLRFSARDAIWQCIGSQGNHLRITLPYGFTVLCWNQANLFHLEHQFDGVLPIGTTVTLQESGKELYEVELLGQLERHVYEGVETIQFVGSILV